MVPVGLAVTEVPVVALSPVAGDHEYVAAPLAVNVAVVPVQIVTGEAVGEAGKLTATTTAVRPLTQPAEVCCT